MTNPEPHTEPPRRRFVNWLLSTSVGGLILSVSYPVTRYLIAPPTAESAASSVTLPFQPGDLAANSGRIFKFGSRPGIVVRAPDGGLRAFSAVCTHLGCVVQFREDLGHIWCACHNGHFDLHGKNIAGPPPRPLEPYDVNVRDGRVVVSKRA